MSRPGHGPLDPEGAESVGPMSENRASSARRARVAPLVGLAALLALGPLVAEAAAHADRLAVALEHAQQALDALGREPGPDALAQANQPLEALVAAARAVVAERSRRQAAAGAYALLTDPKRLARALPAYERRKRVEAQGHLYLSLRPPHDADLLFEVREILLRHGRRDLVTKVGKLSQADLRSTIDALLNDAPAPGGGAIDAELRAFFAEGAAAARQGTADLDAGIDLLAIFVAAWRNDPRASQLPAIAQASLLACRGRLAQDGTDAARREYAAHADLIHRARQADAASEELRREAHHLADRMWPTVARDVFLQVRGDPAREETAYLARLEAAWCLLRADQPREAVAAELAPLFRDGVSSQRLAPVLYQLATALPDAQAPLALRVLQTVRDDVPDADRPRALYLCCRHLIRLGRNGEALQRFAELRQSYPRHAYAAYAERFLREKKVLDTPSTTTP